MIYKALGWQGGTIWQIIAEIKRLKAVEAGATALITDIKTGEKPGFLRAKNNEKKGFWIASLAMHIEKIKKLG